MTIIEPQVELWKQDNPVVHVAKCARVCYGSPTEGKSTAQQLYDKLLKAKHNSMFRHESVYAIIPKYSEDVVGELYDYYSASPYIKFNFYDGDVYIATNENFMIDNQDEVIFKYINQNRVSPEHFANTEIGHSLMRYTFHIITQISTSRELNRVSPNNIAERSTRYVNESNGTICRPHWMTKEEAKAINNYPDKSSVLNLYDVSTAQYYQACDTAFYNYRELLNRGFKREDARGVLPLDTATEVVYTYDVRTWKRLIALRTGKRAHPNCAVVMNMVKQQLEELGYDF